ncbi:MAG: hypothetical protein RR225_05365 [Clostridium sp.]
MSEIKVGSVVEIASGDFKGDTGFVVRRGNSGIIFVFLCNHISAIPFFESDLVLIEKEYDQTVKKYINKHGEIKTEDEACVLCGEERVKFKFMVRCIKDTGRVKCCIAEEVYPLNPSANELKYCLLKHKEASFCVVEQIYFLESEEENASN